MKGRYLSRRSFLIQILAWLGLGLAGARCVPKAQEGGDIVVPSPTFTSQPTATPTLKPTNTPTQPAATATPTSLPTPPKTKVALVRGEEVSQMVARAVELAGGFRGLTPGARVLVKPNVNSDDPYPGTTNPEVVRAVVEVVKGYGPGRIVVADRSNPSYATRNAMERVGIWQAAEEAGAEVMALDEEEWSRVNPSGADRWPNGFSIPRLFSEIDYLITLPVTKTHFIANYTMALKNTVGLIHPQDRRFLHSSQGYDFGARIAEINLARPADFVVMDGTRAFISGGPASGELREPNLILATPDLVAADVVGLAILKYLGAWERVSGPSAWEQPQVARAVELGLGISHGEGIDLVAEGVEEVEEIRAFLG